MPETAQLPSADPVPSADPAKALLAMVGELALELQPHRRGGIAVHLDSKLDRDLGFDSLARAELLLRLGRAFKIRLPEELIAEAETAKDLLDAVLAAEPDRALLTGQTIIRPITLPEATEPVDAQTLVEALATHVSWHGEREHILLWRRCAEEDIITYAGLDCAARAVAGGRAGPVPVPVYPPLRRAQLEEHLRRQARILGNAEANILITNEEIHGAGELLCGLIASLPHIEQVTTPS